LFLDCLVFTHVTEGFSLPFGLPLVMPDSDPASSKK